MSWADVGSFIAKAAPALGAVLGGPVGAIAGAAGSLIAKTLGCDATADSVTAALQADPDALVRLRELEVREQGQILAWQAQQLQAGLDNVKDARAREVAIVQTGHMSLATPIVAIVITLGFFAMLWCVLQGGKEELGDAGLLLLGTLASAFGAVVNYYLGSSLGSASKENLLRRDKK